MKEPGGPAGTDAPDGVGVISLHIPAIFGLMQLAVRRASGFMGLGVNAALDPEVREYQLAKLTGIELLPDAMPDEQLDQLKGAFRLWIEAAGLRELAESFIVFLDRTYEACVLMDEVSRTRRLDGMKRRAGQFAKLPMPVKLQRLASEFGVTSKHVEHLKSINKARNCLAHRWGAVDPEDFNDGDRLTVRWIGLDTMIQEPSGTAHRLRAGKPDVPIGPLPEGAEVQVHVVERTRHFAAGETLALSSQDLAEICWFYLIEAEALTKDLVRVATERGVPVREVPPPAGALLQK